MRDVWAVSSTHCTEEFEAEWSQLVSDWPQYTDHWKSLNTIKEQWCFAWTHEKFVAGIASTQKQESANANLKKDLLRGSRLSDIVDRFERMEDRMSEKVCKNLLDVEMEIGTSTNDVSLERINSLLTEYARGLLAVEMFSLCELCSFGC